METPSYQGYTAVSNGGDRGNAQSSQVPTFVKHGRKREARPDPDSPDKSVKNLSNFSGRTRVVTTEESEVWEGVAESHSECLAFAVSALQEQLGQPQNSSSFGLFFEEKEIALNTRVTESRTLVLQATKGRREENASVDNAVSDGGGGQKSVPSTQNNDNNRPVQSKGALEEQANVPAEAEVLPPNNPEAPVWNCACPSWCSPQGQFSALVGFVLVFFLSSIVLLGTAIGMYVYFLQRNVKELRVFGQSTTVTPTAQPLALNVFFVCADFILILIAMLEITALVVLLWKELTKVDPDASQGQEYAFHTESRVSLVVSFGVCHSILLFVAFLVDRIESSDDFFPDVPLLALVFVNLLSVASLHFLKRLLDAMYRHLRLRQRTAPVESQLAARRFIGLYLTSTAIVCLSAAGLYLYFAARNWSDYIGGNVRNTGPYNIGFGVVDLLLVIAAGLELGFAIAAVCKFPCHLHQREAYDEVRRFSVRLPFVGSWIHVGLLVPVVIADIAMGQDVLVDIPLLFLVVSNMFNVISIHFMTNMIQDIDNHLVGGGNPNQ